MVVSWRIVALLVGDVCMITRFGDLAIVLPQILPHFISKSDFFSLSFSKKSGCIIHLSPSCA